MSANYASPFRVGIVPYLNMLPLVHGLRELELTAPRRRRLEVVAAPPSLMAAMLDRGELDLGMAPVGAVVERPDWRVVGRSMIGSDGPVLSVIALGDGPPETWRRVHPDSHSRSSNALLRILLAGRYGVRPELAEPLPIEGWEPPARPAPGEAFLLIGTRALRWRNLWREEGAVALDLGAAWKEWTGLPTVFAVWALRPGVDLVPGELDAWMDAFEELKARNLARLPEIVAAWPGLAEERLTPAEAMSYLTRNIAFDLTPTARESLKRYEAEGRKLGIFSGQ